MSCSKCVYNPFHQIIRNGGENICPDAFTAASAYCGHNQDNHKDKIIKADELVSTLNSLSHKLNRAGQLLIDQLISLIDDVPSINEHDFVTEYCSKRCLSLVDNVYLYELVNAAAKPVPHGQWLSDDDDIIISGKCSNCGWLAIVGETDVVHLPYCPHCGAKMGGDE